MRTKGLRRGNDRGSTLVEAMIALTILLVGLVGMARLQYYGMSATQGARAATTASELAAELCAALERLPADDARVSGSAGASATTPPAGFGPQQWASGGGGVVVHTWSDGAPIPGARLDAAIEQDPRNPGQPVYVRRWTVWDLGVSATGTPAKVIAVSVMYRERTILVPREVVRYVHAEVRGSFMANITAFK